MCYLAYAFRSTFLAATVLTLSYTPPLLAEDVKITDPASFEFDVIYFRGSEPSPNTRLMDSVTNESYARSSLQGVVDFLKSHRDLIIGIVGHSDKDECAESECKKLSERRAKSVYLWLRRQGVRENQLHAYVGLGSESPVDLSHTELQRQSNRRVEIRAINVESPDRTGKWYE